MSASKRVNYHKSDKKAPLFYKVKVKGAICFPFSFLLSLDPFCLWSQLPLLS